MVVKCPCNLKIEMVTDMMQDFPWQMILEIIRIRVINKVIIGTHDREFINAIIQIPVFSRRTKTFSIPK